MNRDTLVKRVNQRLDGSYHSWEDMKFEFDDAIVEINNRLHSTFPMMSGIMVAPDSKYNYFILTIAEKNIQMYFNNETNMKDYARNNFHNMQTEQNTLEVIPVEYVRSIVVPYVVMRMLQREDEYGNLQTTMLQEYTKGLDHMFANYYTQVPEIFIREDTDMVMTSKQNYKNEYTLDGNNDKNKVYDPFS